MPLIQQRYGDNDCLNVFINDWLKGKKDLVGVQIGSYRGESTELFIKSGVFKRLYCIDPWENEYDSKDISSNEQISLAEQDFDNKFKGNEIVKKIRMASQSAVSMFEDETIDFIYIDACHQYNSVKRDITNYYSKVKIGGIIAGHDYGYPAYPGVKKAVDEFFKEPPLKIYKENSWIYIKK